MNTHQAVAILKKYKEVNAIRIFLTTHYRYSLGTKIRRGEVSSHLSKSNNLTVNVRLHKKIRLVMEDMGARYIKVDGKAYWGDVSRIE
jgi:hypothetical protein